jgi:hypothetical protein
VRYLRLFTNAVTGGVLIASYLVVLVLQLNPQIPIASVTAWRWLRTLVALYGLYLSVGLFLLMLVREALARQPLLPAWLSVRLLAWMSAAGAATAAVLTWANLRGFQAVLGSAASDAMRRGAVATTTFAVVLAVIALLRYSFSRRGNALTAVLLIGSMAGSVIVPLWVRGPGDLPVPTVRRAIVYGYAGMSAPHVRMILLDGASLGYVRQRVAAGQLPNFGLLLDHGAVIDLATLKPTEAVPVWAAAVTGKYPPKNGVRSDALYRIGAADDDPVNLLPDYCFARSLVLQSFVREDRDLTSASLRARPVWDIGADYRVVPGIVNLPLTRPSHAQWGFVVSDAFDDAATSPLRFKDARAADPTTAAETARDMFDGWQARPWTDAVPGSIAGEPPPSGAPASALRQALWDHAYAETAEALDQEFAPRLTAVRYEALNDFGLWFLQNAQPELFGQVARADQPRSVLDRYYSYIDDEIGRALAKQVASPNDLLLVVSGFGMAAVPWFKREVARLLGQSDPSGGHEAAPDGFLMAYGGNVARGQFPRGAIVDLAPTVLYYLGLPVGRDMDGFARTDLFLASYTTDHPIAYIATHEK